MSNFKNILEYIDSNNINLFSKGEIKYALRSIKDIANLKEKKRFYGFFVNDSYAEMEGVEVYLRQGDRLEAFI